MRPVFPSSGWVLSLQIVELGIYPAVDPLDSTSRMLSFIGLGVRPPTAEWGIMVAEGAGYIVSGEWWLALFPGAALMLAVFCFNLLGDGLRDLIDPRRRT